MQRWENNIHFFPIVWIIDITARFLNKRYKSRYKREPPNLLSILRNSRQFISRCIFTASLFDSMTRDIIRPRLGCISYSLEKFISFWNIGQMKINIFIGYRNRRYLIPQHAHQTVKCKHYTQYIIVRSIFFPIHRREPLHLHIRESLDFYKKCASLLNECLHILRHYSTRKSNQRWFRNQRTKQFLFIHQSALCFKKLNNLSMISNFNTFFSSRWKKINTARRQDNRGYASSKNERGQFSQSIQPREQADGSHTNFSRSKESEFTCAYTRSHF